MLPLPVTAALNLAYGPRPALLRSVPDRPPSAPRPLPRPALPIARPPNVRLPEVEQPPSVAARSHGVAPAPPIEQPVGGGDFLHDGIDRFQLAVYEDGHKLGAAVAEQVEQPVKGDFPPQGATSMLVVETDAEIPPAPSARGRLLLIDPRRVPYDAGRVLWQAPLLRCNGYRLRRSLYSRGHADHSRRPSQFPVGLGCRRACSQPVPTARHGGHGDG
jgi:hypothetical protein